MLALVNSGLTNKNSFVDNLFFSATVSIVSPTWIVYSVALSRLPNNKYLVKSLTLVNTKASVDI